jgi:DNA-binding NarL/FixJ family response regulator
MSHLVDTHANSPSRHRTAYDDHFAAMSLDSSSPTNEFHPIPVILADDHPLARQGMRYYLELTDTIRVVAEAGDGQQAIALIERYRPAVAVLDIHMPGLSGIEVARWARARNLATRILILTAYDDTQHVTSALESGVSGYLLKNTDPGQIVAAVHALYGGETFFDPAIRGTLKSIAATASMVSPSYTQLSAREMEVLQEILRGYTDRVIGLNLGISSFTVGNHVYRIFKKLGVSSRTQALARAMALGLVELAPHGSHSP